LANETWFNETWLPTTQATTTTEATATTETTSSEATEASTNETITTATGSANETITTVTASTNEAIATASTTESTVVNCTEEGTPEENYYELYWAELPATIQDAYEALGYMEEIWDAGEDVAADGWNDLSPEQMDAALCAGHTIDDWPGGAGTTSNTTEAVAANNTTTLATNATSNTTIWLDTPSDLFNYTFTYVPTDSPTSSPNEQNDLNFGSEYEPTSGNMIALPNAFLYGLASCLAFGIHLLEMVL